MNQGNENVTSLPPTTNPPTPAASGGGNGNGHGPRWSELDARLREVEKSVGEIKVEIRHLATREDIESMKVSFLKWVLTTMAAALITVTAVLARTFFT